MMASIYSSLSQTQPHYGSATNVLGRSTCPRARPGATQSRTRCFSSFASGKRPCVARDQMVSPSTRTSKVPPLPGSNATSPSSVANVVNSSWAIHAARNSHRHCVQYSISTRGCLGMSLSLHIEEHSLVSSCPLPHRRPDDPAASSRVTDPEEVPTTSGDIERTLVRIPEGTVGRRVYTHRHWVRLQDPALRIPDIDHRARTTDIGARGGHNIPLRIEAHAVDTSLRSPVILTELMQHNIATQRAISQNVVGPELPSLRAGLDHVQSPLVR